MNRCFNNNQPMSARWNFPNCRPSVDQNNSGSVNPGDENGSANNNPQDCMQNKALAMAYIPWQKWDTVYKEEVALERGTIFPELDLPFLGEEVM